MEEQRATTTPRRTPGPRFFMGALLVYLLVVHGASLSRGGLPNPAPVFPSLLADHPAAFAALQPLLPLLNLGLFYACMLALFQLTRRVVAGPAWLGSLAAAVFMAHPAKTEALFTLSGSAALVTTLLMALSVLFQCQEEESRSRARTLAGLLAFALATMLSPVAMALVPILIAFAWGGAGGRASWLRMLPPLALGLVGAMLHQEVWAVYLHAMPAKLAGLLVLVYPIGLLPETASALAASPVASALWAVAAVVAVLALIYAVRSVPFSGALVAALLFRAAPGMDAVDLVTLDGGAQLLPSLASGCIALAAFTRWLMSFEAWGRPAVAITTMICAVLFVLQFQANRNYAARESLPPVHDAERAIRG